MFASARRLIFGSFVLTWLFGATNAWAVTADALRCTFEVRDETDAVLSFTEVSPQVARVPAADANAPGYRETAARFRLSSTTADGVKFGAQLLYIHATNGYSAYQMSCVTQDFCPPRNPVPGGPLEPCTQSGCVIPRGPVNEPYGGWRPVALFDGVPQLDSTGLGDSQSTWEEGSKTYRTSMACRHVGTYP